MTWESQVFWLFSEVDLQILLSTPNVDRRPWRPQALHQRHWKVSSLTTGGFKLTILFNKDSDMTVLITDSSDVNVLAVCRSDILALMADGSEETVLATGIALTLLYWWSSELVSHRPLPKIFQAKRPCQGDLAQVISPNPSQGEYRSINRSINHLFIKHFKNHKVYQSAEQNKQTKKKYQNHEQRDCSENFQ